MATIYGIRTCDTCRGAVRAFEAAGKPAEFRDIRQDPLSEADLERFLAAFGERLVNTRSTTWRGLGETERAFPPATLLGAHPTLMKRPVIDGPAGLTLGWTADVQAAQLG